MTEMQCDELERLIQQLVDNEAYSPDALREFAKNVAAAKSEELLQFVKDTKELLETLWEPVPYEAHNLLRRANKLIPALVQPSKEKP